MRPRILLILVLGAASALIGSGVYFLLRSHNASVAAPVPVADQLFPTAAPSIAPSAIKPGYVGIAKFGAWRLICAPDTTPASSTEPVKPQPAPAPPNPVDPAPPKVAANACRVNQEIAATGHPEQILLAANFGIVGPMRRPALMLRLPATARAGDTIVLRIDDTRVLRTPVRSCSDAECVAATGLSDEEWNELVAAGMVQIAFPIAAGQRVLVDVPMAGLEDATSAMNIAQTASPVSVPASPPPNVVAPTAAAVPPPPPPSTP